MVVVANKKRSYESCNCNEHNYTINFGLNSQNVNCTSALKVFLKSSMLNLNYVHQDSLQKNPQKLFPVSHWPIVWRHFISCIIWSLMMRIIIMKKTCHTSSFWSDCVPTMMKILTIYYIQMDDFVCTDDKTIAIFMWDYR